MSPARRVTKRTTASWILLTGCPWCKFQFGEAFRVEVLDVEYFIDGFEHLIAVGCSRFRSFEAECALGTPAAIKAMTDLS